MTAQLNTQTVTTVFNATTSVYQGGGSLKMEVPQSSVTVSKPLTYEFRVVEYVDKDVKIVKVGLQYKVTEHDNYGTGIVVQDWTDVERVKLPYLEEL